VMIRSSVEVSNCVQRSSGPAYVVTLVHGTFARGAEWTRAGSVMWNTLERNLKDVVVCYFDWSGKNTHQARIDASEQLKNYVLDTAAIYPGSKHFFVAHSHGGNVVLYALRHPHVRELVAGVITMGTPFIT
jgi:triacylglycerol esterase/lipase EstA (alpha/beta hydrolase family)